ncbi:MAG: 6-phosphogluconolactonase [Deltaproteobacteria bacterium]|nr:6-phosphogluconolactonase [Deltaproteobacteria bacterium]
MGFYDVLASDEWRGAVTWDHMHIFFSDERCVPRDHEESNYRMVREHLFDHIPVDAARVYPIYDGGMEPERAAEEYEKTMREVFETPKAPPRFDLILLGVGEDGHTASIFPGQSTFPKRKLVATTIKDRARVTFTPELIDEAAHVWMLVTGDAKAGVVEAIHRRNTVAESYPASLVRPIFGKLTWFLDTGAASRL